MVKYRTLCWLYTGVGDCTGINAVVVVAGLFSRAINVGSTLYCKAGHVWITIKSWGTGADSFMTDGSTDCFSSTGKVSRSADRTAFLVPTRVGVQTVVIYFAFYFETSNVWITLVSFLTGTDRLVFDDSAEGVFSTGTWILTQLVNT